LRTYSSPPARFPEEKWSLPAILAFQNKVRPEKPFIRWTHEREGVTYARAYGIVAKWAASFLAAGIGRSDRVALYMNNSLTHVWCWLALNAVGAVDAPINPAYFGALLAHQLKLVKPRCVVVDATLLPRLQDIRDDIDPGGNIRILVNRDEDPASTASAADTLGLPEGGSFPVAAVDPRWPATILFTSGTTGPSKGVQMPHAQTYFYSEQTVQLHRMQAEDIYMAPFPLFHASARIHGVGAALVTGATCVLYDKFSARLFSERAAGSQATVTHFLGSMMSRIVDQPDCGFDIQSKLRSVMALPLPFSLRHAFCARFGAENLCEVIGMTEASWPVMSPYGEPRPKGAAGLAVADWYEVRIIDPDTDRECANGEVGELAVRPTRPWIMFSGYENAPEKTVEAFRNLWFHTGDMCRLDDEGWFYFVDRLKDSIRRGGENIASYDVEQALLEYQGISDVAVVAHRMDTVEHDEEIRAFLVIDDATPFDLPNLVQHLERRLPRHCIPRFFQLVQELPMTPSGKVQKAALRAMPIRGSTIWTAP
jgi:crotonobetaine/carnitine-CoA ligase